MVIIIRIHVTLNIVIIIIPFKVFIVSITYYFSAIFICTCIFIIAFFIQKFNVTCSCRSNLLTLSFYPRTGVNTRLSNKCKTTKCVFCE